MLKTLVLSAALVLGLNASCITTTPFLDSGCGLAVNSEIVTSTCGACQAGKQDGVYYIPDCGDSSVVLTRYSSKDCSSGKIDTTTVTYGKCVKTDFSNGFYAETAKGGTCDSPPADKTPFAEHLGAEAEAKM